MNDALFRCTKVLLIEGWSLVLMHVSFCSILSILFIFSNIDKIELLFFILFEGVLVSLILYEDLCLTC